MSNLEFAIKYLASVNNIDSSRLNIDFNTFRALMNITMPYNLKDEYYKVEEEILKEKLKQSKITDVSELNEIIPSIYLHIGDITKLRVDGIANACNSKLLGCFVPLHSCVDNAIHSASGLRVRRDLLNILGDDANVKNGGCIITKGYNLASLYIMHTVGPIVNGVVTPFNKDDLKNCYISCLKEASKLKLESVAFPSISTGIYSFPIKEASKIAVSSVINFLKENSTSIKKVVFCLYKEGDFNVYKRTIDKLYK